MPDTILLCENETLILDGAFIHATDYLWSTNETSSQIEVSTGGKYEVTAYVDTVKLYDVVEVILIEADNQRWVPVSYTH